MKLINLKTNKLGQNFKYYEKIDSTQSEIWRLVDSNKITDGMLVMSNIQTNGQGTHGRVWHTDETENIAFSFYVKINDKPERLEGITIDMATIIQKIFEDLYEVKLTIKSPNDLMLNDKKVGGILTQSKVENGINTCKIHFSEDIKQIATSIKKETGIDIDREKIISEFCNRFEKILKTRISKNED